MTPTMKHLIPILFLILAACTSTEKKESSETQLSDKKQKISVMTYNVENLFDNVHDEGKEDQTYLPLSEKQTPQHRQLCGKIDTRRWRDECLNLDWSEEILKLKMQRLATAILHNNENRGPDILIMPEVENINVLNRLNNEYLKAAGYQTVVLVEGPDPRGIDIALLSRLPLIEEPKLNKVPYVKPPEDKSEKERDFRGILQVTLQLPTGEPLTIFGVHFPAQFHPRGYREQTIDFLNQLKKALPEDRMSIAAGDFNISAEEDYLHGLYQIRLSQEWLISHQIGCKKCDGTHSYRGTWSFLDAIAFSKNLDPKGNNKWRLNENSIRVANEHYYQVSRFMTPERFNDGRNPKGVSDHWPLVGEIVLNEEGMK